MPKTLNIETADLPIIIDRYDLEAGTKISIKTGPGAAIDIDKEDLPNLLLALKSICTDV